MVNHRIKVLIVAEAIVSGVRSSVLNILKHIDKEQYEVYLAIPNLRLASYGATDPIGSFCEKASEYGIENILKIDMIKDGGFVSYCRALRQLSKIVKENQIEIIDSHNYYAGLISRPIAKFTKARSIHTPHLFNYKKAKSLLKIKYLTQEYIMGWLFSDIIVAVSDSEKSDILKKKFVRPIKIHTIPNAVDIQHEYQTNVKEKKFTGINFCVLGRVDHEKRVSDILEATVELIEAGYENIALQIVGDGSELEKLKACYQSVPQIYFLGYVNNAQRTILPKIDLLVHTSLYEGLSMSLLEAMVAAKPAIVSDCGSNVEIIQDGVNGIVVPRKDIHRIKEAMQWFCDNSDQIPQMGINAKKVVLENYSSILRLKKLHLLYDRVVAKHV